MFNILDVLIPLLTLVTGFAARNGWIKNQWHWWMAKQRVRTVRKHLRQQGALESLAAVRSTFTNAATNVTLVRPTNRVDELDFQLNLEVSLIRHGKSQTELDHLLETYEKEALSTNAMKEATPVRHIYRPRREGFWFPVDGDVDVESFQASLLVGDKYEIRAVAQDKEVDFRQIDTFPFVDVVIKDADRLTVGVHQYVVMLTSHLGTIGLAGYFEIRVAIPAFDTRDTPKRELRGEPSS